jgi:hypothetical protein
MMHLPAWLLIFIPNPAKFYLDRRTRVIQAGNAFRAAVLAELCGLYPIADRWPKGTGIEPTLKGKFAALQAAVETYKPWSSINEITKWLGWQIRTDACSRRGSEYVYDETKK